ncbi:MAG: DUF1566 domain-containing protein [Desulfobacteraceae bacterium]|nr:DUF1566 domain-containing protein [Desulfobacteraceae bacterium]
MRKKKPLKTILTIITNFLVCGVFINFCFANAPVSQPIVDTGQSHCYSPSGKILYPVNGSACFGQDAQYECNPPAYQNNGDGTVTDRVTGLMWSKAVEKTKVSLKEAKMIADQMSLGGHTDWRVPNIKELYSLMNFSGNTGNANRGSLANAIPFINTDYFDFRFGNVMAGERYIDAQWLSSTKYVSTTMNGDLTLFGVNFADGRIKGYGYQKRNRRRPQKKFYVRFVRGNPYGENDFIDNDNGTITDQATGLVWMKEDSGKGMNWKQALAFAENMNYAGYDDWRLPNAKELQYLVDYTRSPDTTNSPAIDPVFQTSSIFNEAGQKDYPYFWTSTTHLEGRRPGIQGVYISFGRAMGKMRGKIMDVHGAGAQRSDPKSGTGGISRGPQGDFIRVSNYVRLVRGGSVTLKTNAPVSDRNAYPDKIRIVDTPSVSPFVSDSSQDDDSMPRQDQFDPSDRQMPPPESKKGGRNFIDRLDTNGDGKISTSEFDGPSQHFQMFDQNDDGFISEDEAPTGPPPRRRKHQS